MYKREMLEYYLDNIIKMAKKETIDLFLYLQEKGIDIKCILDKANKLNYYVTDDEYFIFNTRSGVKAYYHMESGGVFVPLVDAKYITDFVIIIQKDLKDDPSYILHELLHFVSTKDVTCVRGIPSGICVFAEEKDADARMRNISINEGITDYFAYTICADLYDNSYRYFLEKGYMLHRYYYSALLINLLALESKEKKNRLLKAYVNNDERYVFKEIKRCFNLSKNEARYLFDLGESVILDENIDERNEFEKIVKTLIKFYYYNVFPKEDKDFESRNFELFKKEKIQQI
ncbi:MAG: hypothetical protein RR988_03840 [Clostridia bacterium]